MIAVIYANIHSLKDTPRTIILRLAKVTQWGLPTDGQIQNLITALINDILYFAVAKAMVDAKEKAKEKVATDEKAVTTEEEKKHVRQDAEKKAEKMAHAAVNYIETALEGMENYEKAKKAIRAAEKRLAGPEM